MPRPESRCRRGRPLTAALVAGLGLAAGLAATPASAASAATVAPGTATTLTYCTEAGQRLQLTFFEPARARRPTPAVLQVHGGGWEVGHRIESASASPTVEGLLAAGIAVASIDYRLAPAFPWPAQMQDVVCAMRFLHAEAGALGLDPSRIGAWGSSAGGQLVSLLGTDGQAPAWTTRPHAGEPVRPAAVVDEFGPADLRGPGWSRYLRRIFATVFGRPSASTSAALREASPTDHVGPGEPPFLVLQGTADRLVPASQSEAFAQRLRAAGDEVRLVLVRGGGHGLDTPGEVPSSRWLSGEIVRFFRRTLGGRPSAVTSPALLARPAGGRGGRRVAGARSRRRPARASAGSATAAGARTGGGRRGGV